ncbi:unnamed protein product [Cylindrotheca closterium]|uniref:Uncharacterized protein n=1 Tax=Cylindrotheca closterium TaxID=2856 RepID=A0AAD2CVX2_9STRA|nr:unnamed protein product [Cylindrotheca closterium]
MQNERTIQFWDEYHKENESIEWISQPSEEVLIILQDYCFDASAQLKELRNLSMLEIGCGTSSLARDFWQHLVKTEENKTFRMVGTDVSSECIKSNIERDRELLSSDEASTTRTCLHYRTLDVINPSEGDTFCCEIILDKGCLDTFLFRSRNRGANKSSYNPIIQSLLDNVWKWLSDDGVYMFISPRSKLKAVRDYSGFQSIQRLALPTVSNGNLVGKTKSSGYVYVCRKNPAYVIGTTPAFAGRDKDTLPSDATTCPNCNVDFLDFRKGELIGGRGAAFWTRQWKGHCQHCKGQIRARTEISDISPFEEDKDKHRSS